MRFTFLFFALATICGTHSAVAQQADSRTPAAGNSQERIALSARPERAAPARPRLACAPLMGTVYDPNGKPLVGATLLIKGTHDIYVTDSEGRFQLTDPVYEGQILDVQAAGYSLIEVPLDDCTLPRLVLAPMPTAKFKQRGKKEGQVIRLNHRSTNLR
ncbi:carboxypeptidase-like regulatory domain-containing protein [Hymenobacter monticola]|uniref:Carboxypeptidase-like regulatory domain-containing protein n=1 Tax=Hymenobacter monticola TaxID=1705399 RepID=A0ABY4BA23_9BACT|nr:carboxypeptidase-like regulatory domain-containing protein [Hymenobacter monticola]UOE34531.1 carboxypeptidase-like regulatory domain-containing protein [Hymenobacter monticola]